MSAMLHELLRYMRGYPMFGFARHDEVARWTIEQAENSSQTSIAARGRHSTQFIPSSAGDVGWTGRRRLELAAKKSPLPSRFLHAHFRGSEFGS
jgi:hypothetical protein